MKKVILIGLSSLLITGGIFGQSSLSDKKGGGMAGSSPSLEGLKTESTKKTPKKPQKDLPQKQALPPPVKLPPLTPQQAEYLHPGILVFFNGKWEGSDHLLNLTNNIGVNITIFKPEAESIDISDIQIKKEVEEIFKEANIKPQTLAAAGSPPLPTFEIEIFIYPIERGYAAYCEGRLFESVKLDRFKMDSNMAFQAITWENQHLIVSPKNQFSEQLTKTIQDIATSFTERFLDYERLKRSANL